MIRAAGARADLELCVAVNNAVNPDSPVTADQLDGASGAFLLYGDDGYAYVDRAVNERLGYEPLPAWIVVSGPVQ